MEELKTTGTYEEFRETLNTELQKNVDSFIKIGYLLKLARDTDILYKSGYKSVTEFAAAEYGLTKDVVSRYIAINDRYSENGYGEQLKEEYRAFGVAKLAEMLTLSDEVIQSLSPELTRKEIQKIKGEIREEEKVTDIEVMMESTEERPEYDTLAEQALYQYMKENKEEFARIYNTLQFTLQRSERVEKLLDAMAPSGIAAKFVRIPGKGKIMLSIKGKDEKVDFLNTRTNEKESCDWSKVIECLMKITREVYYDVPDYKKAYELMYGAKFEEQPEQTESPEVAPVQPAQENKEEPKEQPEVEKVTGEVVEETQDLEEIKKKLATEFIKRYETRLEESENMRDEVSAILDRVHKDEWILKCGGEEYFVVEVAGYIKLCKGEEIITTFYWADFYQMVHEVYWKEAENYMPPRIPEENTDESCTGATEEQVQGQTAIEDYPEYLPENIKSNMEIWQELKAQVKARIESISKAAEEDNYALIKWDAQKLVELMGAIR